MDWIQFVTNMISIGAPMAGAVYIFYSITTSRIDRMEDFHREDMKLINDALVRMDTKWERLFERFIIQDQGKKVK